MSVASVAELKEELSFTADNGTADDVLLGRHLSAAEALIERSLGFTFTAQYTGATPPAEVPAALKQAVLWLAVDFYEGRGVPEKGDGLPAHVENIVQSYREWSF
ncbi:MAG: head-tail connector protein [Tabrizicola sp.]